MSIPNSSAGVYVSERDLSGRTERALSTVAVIVGEANRGPVGQRTLVTSESEYVDLFGPPDVSIGYMGHSAIAYLQEGNRLYVTRVSPTAKFGGCVIGWDGTYNTSRSFNEGVDRPEYEIPDMSSTDLFSVYAINPGAWNNDVFIRVYPNTKIYDGFFYLEVYLTGYGQPVEKWHCHLDYVVDGFGRQLNIAQQINRGSRYIRINQNVEHEELATNTKRQFINVFDAGGELALPGRRFRGGSNGRRPSISEFMEALQLYADSEHVDINLLINGGICDPAYQKAMDTLCQNRMDCVAILDTPSDMQDVQSALTFRRDTLHMDSSYSALYSPDVLAADKYNDIRLYCPPSGFVAACYARTDREFESWFAPAGMNRGDLKVAGLRAVYDQGKRNALYESQVNAIRIIEGSGIKIWGADTLQVRPSSLSNMSVRRLMIVLEKTIANELLYAVFDPNDQQLRSRIETVCRSFLDGIKAARGLYGYEAICNDSNNKPATIAMGDLYVDIWCDPVLPAKRVMFNAIINKTGVRVTGNA